jgi:hypothetical protein
VPKQPVISPVGFVPIQDRGAPNANSLLRVQKQGVGGAPVCVGATGAPGTIAHGTPGAESTITWTILGPIYDSSQMLFGSPTSNIRITIDGFYSFYLFWWSTDNIAANIETRLQIAPTSDSGFGAPSFAEPTLDGIVAWRDTVSLGTATSARSGGSMEFRGVELHANDLVRFQVRQDNATTDLTGTNVLTSEFRFLYPIPNASQGQIG